MDLLDDSLHSRYVYIYIFLKNNKLKLFLRHSPDVMTSFTEIESQLNIFYETVQIDHFYFKKLALQIFGFVYSYKQIVSIPLYFYVYKINIKIVFVTFT